MESDFRVAGILPRRTLLMCWVLRVVPLDVEVVVLAGGLDIFFFFLLEVPLLTLEFVVVGERELSALTTSELAGGCGSFPGGLLEVGGILAGGLLLEVAVSGGVPVTGEAFGSATLRRLLKRQ